MTRIVSTLIRKNKVDARYITLFPHLALHADLEMADRSGRGPEARKGDVYYR